jgi:hypothetical protein
MKITRHASRYAELTCADAGLSARRNSSSEGPSASTGRPLRCLPYFAARPHQRIKHGVSPSQIAIATGNANRLS